jgi:hypothetical protein
VQSVERRFDAICTALLARCRYSRFGGCCVALYSPTVRNHVLFDIARHAGSDAWSSPAFPEVLAPMSENSAADILGDRACASVEFHSRACQKTGCAKPPAARRNNGVR